ncbi:XapX domain-containing protein [Lysobacter sp. A289]
MKPYVISLAVGLLVGVIYATLKVRSPAPPTIALIGLFGMLLGEQMVPVAKRLISGESVISLIRGDCAEQVLGQQAGPDERKA